MESGGRKICYITLLASSRCISFYGSLELVVINVNSRIRNPDSTTEFYSFKSLI
jgi:hypothetical protein